MTVLGTTFRLGSTSYVWEEGLVPNVQKLGPLVDDVELVLFEVEGHSNLPSAKEVAELNALARAHDLSYTVHLPLDLGPDSPRSLELAAKVIDCTRDLLPWSYVLHLDGRRVEGAPDQATLSEWQTNARQILEEVAELAGEARRLCVENLENYQPEAFLPLLDQVPVGLCVDVGHFWLVGRDPLPFLEEHLAQTRVVHLHGPNGQDHQALVHQDAEQVAAVLNVLSRHNFDGVLTLEVFGRADFMSSRQVVAEVLNGTG